MKSALSSNKRKYRATVLTIVGTRPEAVKMVPVIRALRSDPRLHIISVTTGQHREMLDQVFGAFGEKPDHDLKIMKSNQSLAEVTTSVLSGVAELYSTYRPNLVLVQGDTTTAMAATLGAFYAGITVGHVEAGLRSGDLKQPWPEEFNRVLIDSVAQLLFAPTSEARTNLLAEYNRRAKIYVTGNTGIDALLIAVEILRSEPARKAQIRERYSYLDNERRLILVTGHRRENFGAGLEHICDALGEISSRSDVQILYPVHLNPNVRVPVLQRLKARRNIRLIEPVEFFDMVYLMERAYLIITDSGGIQEEAPALGKPVLVTRNTTERPEAVLMGTVKLVGTDPSVIHREAVLLLEDDATYRERARPVFPYGDGKAAGRIRKIISREFT
jgi:UDP-N-acetylglucosamine 2-epimerase (non-hydrolysing)